MSQLPLAYHDPAQDRMTASQSVQLIKGQMIMLVLALGMMLIGMISMFYVSTTFGWLLGLIVGIAEVICIGIGFGGFYYAAVLIPVSQGLNLSAQSWESPSDLHGDWLISQRPLEEIPMDDDERKLPVRIPFGKYERVQNKSENGKVDAPVNGLEMIEELRLQTPKCSDVTCKCEYHKTPFRVDHAEIYNKIPELTFDTYAYVMTPNNAGFKQAIIISPCKIDSLRKITDLMFFKGFPVMGSTTFVALSRVFELDETSQFGGPCYLVSFSSWHVEMAQRLAGFTPAFMVPTVEQIVHIFDIRGVTEAMKMSGIITTLRSRVASLESNQPDFRTALAAGITHERKLEDAIDLFKREVGSKWLQPKYLTLFGAIVIAAVAVTYLLVTFVK